MDREFIIVQDFDGYFENKTKSIMDKVTNSKIKKVTVQAIPYVPYAVKYEFDDKEGNLTFTWYSALRTMFGCLTTEDIESLISELNAL